MSDPFPREPGLLAGVLANPSDPVVRVVYADWIEEHDTPACGYFAAYIRLETELLTRPADDPENPRLIAELDKVRRGAGTVLGGWEYVAELERMRLKMDAVRAGDPARSAFGAGGRFGDQYLVNPPVDELQLLAAERRLGMLLPAEFRAFLLRIGNGRMGPGYGMDPVEPARFDARMTSAFPYSESDGRRLRELIRTASASHDWDPVNAYSWDGEGAIAIADHGCGTYDILVVRGPDRGRVWSTGDFLCPATDEAGDPVDFIDWYDVWLDERLAAR